MFGFLWFKNVYVNLGENCRNKLLGNLFCLENVKASNYVVLENKFIFNFWADGVFYRYLFVLSDGKHEFYCDDKTVVGKIYLYNDEDLISNRIFVSIAMCQVLWVMLCPDEYKFYCYLKECL